MHHGNHWGVVLYGIEIPKRIWRHYLQDSPSYGIYDTTSRDSFISDKAKQVARGSVPFRLLFSIIVCTSNLKANFSYGKETSIFLQQESALNSFFNFRLVHCAYYVFHSIQGWFYIIGNKCNDYSYKWVMTYDLYF